jgi:hypothetical protein
MEKEPTQTRRRLALLLILGGILLVLGALAIAFQGDTPEITGGEDLPFPEVSRIPVEDARILFETGDALFLDVRGQADYALAHIPGAILMPASEVQLRHQELSKEFEILTYCT